MHRFSAFWLRSKCSICSYQLNIWYEDHVSSSILNLFLQGDGTSGACSGSIKSWLCIAVPQRSAHFPTFNHAKLADWALTSYIWDYLIPIFFSIFIIELKRCIETADWLDSMWLFTCRAKPIFQLWSSASTLRSGDTLTNDRLERWCYC